MKIAVLFAVIIVQLIFLYWTSFTSPFFQDDIIFLTAGNISSLFSAIPQGVYRPVSFQLFYTVSKNFFGLNPLPFHLVLFIFFITSLVLVYRLSVKILKKDRFALSVVYFYALNVSLFALFYWIATSYFVLGSFFIFLSLYLYLFDFPLLLSLPAFVAGLFSNEIAAVLPVLLILTSWYFKTWKKSILTFFAADAIFILLKIFVIGFPKSSSYGLKAGSFLSNFRWYFFRTLNIPEGIKRSSDSDLYTLLILFLACILFAIYIRFKSKNINFRLYVFAFFWFFIGALPFFFLPGHMSSFYLTVSLFGPAIFYADILSIKPKILIAAMTVYFFLSFKGLAFLSQTHWIILKNTGPAGTP